MRVNYDKLQPSRGPSTPLEAKQARVMELERKVAQLTRQQKFIPRFTIGYTGTVVTPTNNTSVQWDAGASLTVDVTSPGLILVFAEMTATVTSDAFTTPFGWLLVRETNNFPSGYITTGHDFTFSARATTGSDLGLGSPYPDPPGGFDVINVDTPGQHQFQLGYQLDFAAGGTTNFITITDRKLTVFYLGGLP